MKHYFIKLIIWFAISNTHSLKWIGSARVRKQTKEILIKICFKWHSHLSFLQLVAYIWLYHYIRIIEFLFYLFFFWALIIIGVHRGTSSFHTSWLSRLRILKLFLSYFTVVIYFFFWVSLFFLRKYINKVFLNTCFTFSLFVLSLIHIFNRNFLNQWIKRNIKTNSYIK